VPESPEAIGHRTRRSEAPLPRPHDDVVCRFAHDDPLLAGLTNARPCVAMTDGIPMSQPEGFDTVVVWRRNMAAARETRLAAASSSA
jgi:hypothetical protein